MDKKGTNDGQKQVKNDLYADILITQQKELK